MGYMELHDLYADHKQAPLNDSTTFVITDQDAFGRFTQALITQSNFTWRLNCPSLRVKAVHFPVDDGLVFQKDLTIPGETEIFHRPPFFYIIPRLCLFSDQ